jgi:DNA-binding response OmpR family regulator
LAKILVTEDEPYIYKMLEFRLNTLGHEISLATDGEKALELVSSSRPDLVLLDVMMPVMGGFQVLRRLKEDEETSSIPVIMLSAKGQEEDIVTGLENGAFDYITKPFSFPELIARIDRALASTK